MTMGRIEALRQRMADENLPSVLITEPTNRYYMSGFSGSAGILFITYESAILLTDFRYLQRAAQEAPDYEIVQLKDGLPDAVADLFAASRVAKMGFESGHVTYASHQALAEKLPDGALVPARNLIESLRAVKSEREQALIRRAVEIADGAYGHLKLFIRPGMTEKQVAWELEVWMRTHGADGIAFSITVASGPNGAAPHALTSDREIAAGEPIIVDMGALVERYRSDLTRTFCLNEADERFNGIFDIVLNAQEAAERRMAPGMKAAGADALARDVIAAAGYAEQFGHGLGHGVGLDIHEMPHMGPRSEEVLAAGQVATVEPGIYLPGWGGVRIEDMVVLTEAGADVLTQAPKDRVVRVRD